MILQFCDESLVPKYIYRYSPCCPVRCFYKASTFIKIGFSRQFDLISLYVLNKPGHYRSGLCSICKCSPPEANLLWKWLHIGLLWARNGKYSHSPWMKARGTDKMSWLPGSQAVNFSLSFLTYSPVKQLQLTHSPVYSREAAFTLLWDMCVISWSFLFRQLIVPRIFCV